MIGETCPDCGRIGHPTVTVGRFKPTGPDGYRALGGGPLRPTRALAETDVCNARLANGPLTCIRTDPHDPGPHGGHIYESTSAGDDRHTDGGHG